MKCVLYIIILVIGSIQTSSNLRRRKNDESFGQMLGRWFGCGEKSNKSCRGRQNLPKNPNPPRNNGRKRMTESEKFWADLDHRVNVQYPKVRKEIEDKKAEIEALEKKIDRLREIRIMKVNRVLSTTDTILNMQRNSNYNKKNVDYYREEESQRIREQNEVQDQIDEETNRLAKLKSHLSQLEYSGKIYNP